MDHIVELIRNAPVEKATTEKAQIVLIYRDRTDNTFVRYNSVKKAEKEYAKLKAAWLLREEAKPLYDLDGDMFVCTVDLTSLAAVCYVDLAKHAKFVPWKAPE